MKKHDNFKFNIIDKNSDLQLSVNKISTNEFENQISNIIGVNKSFYFNTDTYSPLYISLHSLIRCGKIKFGDKIIVPSLTTGIDLSPILSLNLIPIFIDCEQNDLSIDVEKLEIILSKENPSCLLLVNVLGLVQEKTNTILSLCYQHKVCIVEDFTEGFMSKANDLYLGSLGTISYFQNSKVGIFNSKTKGCLILSSNDNISESILNFKTLLNSDENVYFESDIFDKIKSWSKNKYINFTLFQDYLSGEFVKFIESEKSFINNYAYPLIHKKKNDISKYLLSIGISYKRLVYCDYKSVNIKAESNQRLCNSLKISKKTLYIPNNHLIKESEVIGICKKINHIIK